MEPSTRGSSSSSKPAQDERCSQRDLPTPRNIATVLSDDLCGVGACVSNMCGTWRSGIWDIQPSQLVS
jgi:hypothetical protein